MSDNCISTVQARWTPKSMCESPACGPGVFAKKHKASYAFRVHRENLTPGFDYIATASTASGKQLANAATDKGLLLCPCCMAILLAMVSKQGLPYQMFNIQDVATENFEFSRGCLEKADHLTQKLAEGHFKANEAVKSMAVDMEEIHRIVRTEGIDAAKRFLASKIISGLPDEIFGKTSKPSITNDERLDIHDILRDMSTLPKNIKLN